MWASLVPLSQLTILRGPINCAECENCMSRLMCGAAYIYRWLCESAKGNQNRPHIIVDRQRRQRRSTCQRDWRIAKKPVKCDTWIVWFSYRRSNWLQLNESLSNRIRRIADIYIYISDGCVFDVGLFVRLPALASMIAAHLVVSAVSAPSHRLYNVVYYICHMRIISTESWPRCFATRT